MKVRVFRDEWYPVYCINDDADEEDKLEIDDSIVNAYVAADRAFQEAHKALREAWETAQGKGAEHGT